MSKIDGLRWKLGPKIIEDFKNWQCWKYQSILPENGPNSTKIWLKFLGNSFKNFGNFWRFDIFDGQNQNLKRPEFLTIYFRFQTLDFPKNPPDFENLQGTQCLSYWNPYRRPNSDTTLICHQMSTEMTEQT